MAGLNIGGVLPVKTLSDLTAQEQAEDSASAYKPVVDGLAGHVRSCWQTARAAKMRTVEPRLLQAVRQRRGEYDPDVLQEIKKTGGSEIYMLLTSNKCRAASSWLRDVLLGVRNEKPWSIAPTPIPDLPEDVKQQAIDEATMEAQQLMMGGLPLTQADVFDIAKRVKTKTLALVREEAIATAERMELKMEDQLLEGGFNTAFSEFLDDIVTFPAAILKGPVVRKRKHLSWGFDATGGRTMEPTDQLSLEWERVDPFMVYPSPGSADVDDGFFIERHKLKRRDLTAMRGVEGYSTEKIDSVLREYGKGGLRDWLTIDTQKAEAEGRDTATIMQNPDGEIDALQFWGSVQGKHLVDWGLPEADVEDPLADYPCEVWLIGEYVIKAMVNPDPLGRIPYYKCSFEEIPGAFWGNAIPDLVRDAQSVCNAAARAIVNNMGISSGPQVVVNVDRLPAGEDLTNMYPWKVWQVQSDPLGATDKAIGFETPPSIAGELMQIYERFSVLADEYSGIPRYMTGDSPGGGAGRTASGMSMLMQNAGKTIKQVISQIDSNILKPLVERLYFYNMRYDPDTDLKGDVKIIAQGANALVVKDAAQVRRNEFLQLALNSPVVQQIVGMEGIAHLLREGAKVLDMDTEKIVPSEETVRFKSMQQQAMMAQQAAMQSQMPQQGAQQNMGSGQQLEDGTEVTDNFQPQPTNM